jgi:hypothetical protein
MMIELIFQPQFEDFRNGRHLLIDRTKKKDILFSIIVIFLIVITLIYFIYKYEVSTDIFFLFAGGIILCILLFVLLLNNIHSDNLIKDAYEQEIIYMENYRILLDQENITISSKYVTNIFPWKYIKKIKENNKSILIYYTNNFAINIPKRLLSEENKYSILKELISSKEKPYKFVKDI